MLEDIVADKGIISKFEDILTKIVHPLKVSIIRV